MGILQIHSTTQHQISTTINQLNPIRLHVNRKTFTNPAYSKNAATTEIHQTQWSMAAHCTEASAYKTFTLNMEHPNSKHYLYCYAELALNKA